MPLFDGGPTKEACPTFEILKFLKKLVLAIGTYIYMLPSNLQPITPIQWLFCYYLKSLYAFVFSIFGAMLLVTMVYYCNTFRCTRKSLSRIKKVIVALPMPKPILMHLPK
jgi:sensor histidine kinase YesM